MYSPRTESKKSGVMSKVWERCKSFSGVVGRKGSAEAARHALKTKSNSWPRASPVEALDLADETTRKISKRAAPKGCFPIYVGRGGEKFAIKTEDVNHPLFRILLEEAESEYGYRNKGPLRLPCEVDRFISVLMEIDCSDQELGDDEHEGCNFVATHHPNPHHFLTPPRSRMV